jgi:hypothetical protein
MEDKKLLYRLDKKTFAKLDEKRITIKWVSDPYRMRLRKGQKPMRFELDNKEWKEVVWNDGKKEFGKERVDFKTDKIKYDLIIECDEPITAPAWDKESGSERDITESSWYVSGMRQGDIKSFLQKTYAAEGKTLDETGYDWEVDKVRDLIGMSFDVVVSTESWELDGKSGTYDTYTAYKPKRVEKKEEANDEQQESELPF